MNAQTNSAQVAADLPFDWAIDMPGCRLVDGPVDPDAMHARATSLAEAQMLAHTPAQSAEGEIVAFRAERSAEAQAIRDAAIAAHKARNAAEHEAALARKAERMAAHEARNGERQVEAKTRKVG